MPGAPAGQRAAAQTALAKRRVTVTHNSMVRFRFLTTLPAMQTLEMHRIMYMVKLLIRGLRAA